MPRPLTTRMDPVAGARSVTAARIIDVVRAVGVVVVTITVSLARPGPATAGPQGTAIAVLLATSGFWPLDWSPASRPRNSWATPGPSWACGPWP